MTKHINHSDNYLTNVRQARTGACPILTDDAILGDLVEERKIQCRHKNVQSVGLAQYCDDCHEEVWSVGQ